MKLCSIMFTVGWAAALVFGFLAVSAPAGESAALLVTHVLLAAAGAAAGLWSWLRVCRVN
ncbi:MAG: hypothetical protein IE927_01960 [Rhodobacterales bacterium]|nr:hypothetical protein [Rhodobacterales bacterium]